MSYTNNEIRKELQVWAVRNDESLSDFLGFVRRLDIAGSVGLDIGTATLVKSSSDHDTQYRVFEIDGQFFCLEGTEDSWSDTEWDTNPYEVRPQPVNEVQYRRV